MTRINEDLMPCWTDSGLLYDVTVFWLNYEVLTGF